MTAMALTPDDLLRHHDEAGLWPGPSGLALDEAYARALAVRRLRIARGEQPRGYKVGFTNRGIWPRYNVFAPIWGTVWDTTLVNADEGEAEVSLAGLCQPRLEPEAVFGLAATPPPDATLAQLWACVDWVAPGFELVQSHLAGWKFEAGDTVADGGLHGRLVVGLRVPASRVASAWEEAAQVLAQAQVHLLCNGNVLEQGAGRNVLDGPLQALAHFARALHHCPGAPALRAGDVVTTGTWTDAWPVVPGQRWQALFDAPLSPLAVRFG